MSETEYKQPRREDRYIVRVPVVLICGGVRRELFTRDVSFRGLFVCTDQPPVLRQLISIEAKLPPEDTLFISHGMSVYAIEPGGLPQKPGIGVQFYAQSGVERRKWEDFIGHIKDRVPTEPGPDDVEPVNRLHPRIDAVFEVHPKNIDELEVLYTRDVSKGGMFLATTSRIDLGHGLRLEVFHPMTDKSFTLDAIVRRQSDEEPVGLGVEFINMSEAMREEFYAFVQDGITHVAIES